MLRLVLSQPLHSASPQRSSAPFNLLFLSVSDLFWSPRSLRSLSKEYTRTIMIVFLKQGKSPSQRGFPHGDFPSTHFPLSLSLSLLLTHTHTHTHNRCSCSSLPPGGLYYLSDSILKSISHLLSTKERH